jgi:hypothetical protein
VFPAGKRLHPFIALIIGYNLAKLIMRNIFQHLRKNDLTLIQFGSPYMKKEKDGKSKSKSQFQIVKFKEQD